MPNELAKSVCRGTKLDGESCTREVAAGEKYCWQHASGLNHKWRSLTRNQSVFLVLAIIGIVLALVFGIPEIYWHYHAQIGLAVKPLPPNPPGGLSAMTETRASFQDLERPVSISQMQSPCSPKSGKTYSFYNLDAMPSGAGLKRPMLLAKPNRFVIRNSSSSPEIYDLFLEVSVTNRGEPSVAKDWRVCLVDDGQPSKYMPEEITPSDVSSFQDKTLLEEATTKAPLKRGEAVVGWLRFRVPPSSVTKTFTGSIECRDYLEHKYFTGFGIIRESPRASSQP
jgi:hypothetical protein